MFILDLGSRIRIFSVPNPRSWIQIFSILDPWSWIWIFSIPDVGSRIRIKEFKYFCQKNGFSALRNMIRVFHPGSGSRIWILIFYLSRIQILDPRSRIQGSKKHRIPAPGSWIRIRNNVDFGFAQAVGGSVGYWLFNGRCCLNNSFNGSALSSFYAQKRILRIFYFHIFSLVFTVFKLWCPAHLFPNTPRTSLTTPFGFELYYTDSNFLVCCAFLGLCSVILFATAFCISACEEWEGIHHWDRYTRVTADRENWNWAERRR